MAFDQYAAMYDNYIILGCAIKLTAIFESGANTSGNEGFLSLYANSDGTSTIAPIPFTVP